jgi:hypothetical protein
VEKAGLGLSKGHCVLKCHTKQRRGMQGQRQKTGSCSIHQYIYKVNVLFCLTFTKPVRPTLTMPYFLITSMLLVRWYHQAMSNNAININQNKEGYRLLCIIKLLLPDCTKDRILLVQKAAYIYHCHNVRRYSFICLRRNYKRNNLCGSVIMSLSN